MENGLTLEDSLQVGMMLEENGIDAIELSGGLLNNPNIMQSKIDTQAVEAHFQNEARAFKEKIAVPLILVGGIRSLEVANRLVDEGVAASQPHPPGTEYQISIGLEQWDASFIPVIKIQLFYEGKMANREPSFPLGSEDPQKVTRAISELLEEYAAGTPKE